MSTLRVRNGKLVKSEADIERYARDWVEREHRGKYIDMKAENLKRNGAPAFTRGTLDGVGIIPWGADCTWQRVQRGLFLVVYFEWKADRARTKKSHLAEQTATAAQLRRDGYLVYQAPEGCEDVIEHFHEWAREHGL